MLDNIFSIHVTKMEVRSREKGKKETILGTEHVPADMTTANSKQFQ